MKNLQAVLLLIFGIVLESYSQPNNEPVTITIPPSPTAQSITEYGIPDVSYNTGTPNISIPITTVSAGRFTLPISISNHASGIRVGEDASWIGVGWTLNGGGAISRTVRGLPDGVDQFGYFDFNNSYNFPLDDSNTAQYGILNDLAAGKYDGLPDIYSYSFAGNSGKFLIEWDGGSGYELKLLTQSNLKGTVTMTSLTPVEPESFTFVTPDGTTFTFSVKEETITDVWSDNSNGDQFVSSWFITSIESADHKTIDFRYQDETIDQDILVQYTDYPINSCNAKSPVTSMSQTERFTKRLDSIIGEDKFIAFIPKTSARTDLGGTSYALKSINVNNQYDVDFTTYTSSGGRRMYLSAMEKSIPNGENELYQFQYHNLDLPSTDSKDQDYWGFYNNAGNLTLLPRTPEMSALIQSGDREPNEDKMLSGSLKRITYPTGGYTEYIMEPNKEIRESTGAYVEKQKIFIAEDVLNDETVAASSAFNANFEQNISFTIDMDFTPVYGESAIVDVRIKSGGTIVESATVVDGEQWTFYNVPSGNYIIEVWNSGGIDVVELTVTADYEEYSSGTVTEGRLIGGLRVKEIIRYDGENYLYNFYKYEDSRVLSDLDVYDFVFDIETMSGACFGANAELCSHVGRTSSIRNSQPSQIISYGKVTEFTTSTEEVGFQPINPVITPLPDTEIGKTVYTYRHPYSSGGGGLPYMPIQEHQYSKGQLLSKTIYNQNGNKLSETINEYDVDPNDLNSLMYAKAAFILDWWCFDGTSAIGYDQISAHYITPKTGWKRLLSTENIEYDPADETKFSTVKTNYHYFDDSVIIFKPIKEVTQYSDRQVTKYSYFTDSYSSGLSHITDYPELLIEQITTVDYSPGGTDSEMLVSAQAIEYSTSGPWPTAFYKLENEQPITSSNYSYTKSNGRATTQGAYSLSSELKTQATYGYTDGSQPGKVTSIFQQSNGRYKNYEWDDKGRLITEIINYDQSDFFFKDFESGTATSSPFQGNRSKILSSQFVTSIQAGDYYVEFWKKGNVTLVQNTGQSVNAHELYTKDGWTYVQARLSQSSNGNLTIQGDGGNNDEIDCLRVYPQEAQMTNYMYNEFGFLTEVVSATGTIQFYTYDNLGRLLYVIDHEGNVLQQNSYNYKN